MLNRKKYFVLAAALFVLFAVIEFSSCGKSDKNVEKTEKQSQTVTDSSKIVADGKYFCPMHPLEQSNDAGTKCPICKMKMISKADYNKEMMDRHEELEKKFEGKKDAIHFEVKLSAIKSSDCAQIIESVIQKDEGIMGNYVDILDRVVHMYINKTKTSKSNVEKLISDAGFDANDVKANPDAVSKLPSECR